MDNRTIPNPVVPPTEIALRSLPCRGVCCTSTWPALGFVCSANNTEIDGMCTNYWGHPGDHVECTAEGHAVKVWPRTGRLNMFVVQEAHAAGCAYRDDPWHRCVAADGQPSHIVCIATVHQAQRIGGAA